MSVPLLALFLTAFAFGTAEFVIAGLLPEVALGLSVSVPVAGYLISGYAIGIAVLGPLLTLATKKFNRKTTVVVLGALFAVGQALCAIAPNFELLMAARVFVSALHGAFFGMAFVISTGLVPPERRGFAVALVLSGLTVSNVIGVPLGTAIGQLFDWRATFWAVGALGLIASIVIAVFLPKTAGSESTQSSFAREFKALGRQQVYLGLAIATFVMLAQYAVFTYIAPLYLEVTRLEEEMVPIMLLIYGVGATIGVFLGGRLADWNLGKSIVLVLAGQVLLFASLYFVAPYPLAMGITTFIWGGVNFAFGSPLQSRMLLWANDAPNLTSSLIPTGFNVGIAVGAILSANLLEQGMGYHNLPWVGTVVITVALLLAVISVVWEAKSTNRPPTGDADTIIVAH
ncbi:MFS transporter [Devosia sp. MC1541]|uniref:MFS transporter n=1 Tax=Devosia sp. MC1541 TaxID=2725264 RepID=UPI00145F72E8|nr:MFS transporter [Devosia sp. MC1541]